MLLMLGRLHDDFVAACRPDDLHSCHHFPPQGLAPHRGVLSQHVVTGSLEPARAGSGRVTALAGHRLAPSLAGNFVTIDDALVTAPDLKASNVMAHVVDPVLPRPGSEAIQSAWQAGPRHRCPRVA
jgi:hypothetical protein